MKLLNGSELADYIKERQSKQVRNLRQSWNVAPKLAIISTTDNPVSAAYMRLKQRYGDDILVDVNIHSVTMEELLATIDHLNNDQATHGIILQLPLADPSMTDDAVDAVAPHKDVDGLGKDATFTAATPLAIDWLLAGYNIELAHKKIAIVGKGRLVGAPLYELWNERGLNVTAFDETDDDIGTRLRQFDVVVTAVGSAGLIKSESLAIDAVVVDAGTSSENGEIKGDIAADARQRNDLTITPEKGGVGPLTVAALFDNVITSARRTAEDKKE